MAVLYFTNLPRWVNVQFTRWNLESLEGGSRLSSTESSLYAYQISFENTLEEQVSLSGFRGKKVFLSLWASWCVPCIAEFASLEKLSTEFPELHLVMLNIEDKPTFSSFIEETNYQLPFYVLKTPLPAALNAPAIPASFILDEDGKIIYKHFGAVDWSSRSTIAKLNDILR